MKIKTFKLDSETLQLIEELKDMAVKMDMDYDLETMKLVPMKEYKFNPWEGVDFDRTPRDYEGGEDE